MIAISWFILVCFPFVPAFVFVIECILKVDWIGINFLFLDVVYKVAESDAVDNSIILFLLL